jgi:S-adenosylmethionine:tRNA ribosyltransferase-isomerase
MRVSDFDFHLPEECIALRPIVPREAAKMLVAKENSTQFYDKHVHNLSQFLRAGDVLVVNDTKVIRARLKGVRIRGDAKAAIEVLLHQRVDQDSWKAFIRPAKKLNLGETICFSNENGELSAQLLEKNATGDVLLKFDKVGAILDTAIAIQGELPLPPYIMSKRKVDAQDSSDYQTIFAKEEGAVAAPTAGLHLTQSLIKEIEAIGVTIETVTLHVGAGTFLPVKVDDTNDHVMHGEWGIVSTKTALALNNARAKNGRIIAVGTTSLRLLESAVDEQGAIQPFSQETRIFITPGFQFKAVDVLLTNFHLPKSTLFMLVSAFCGTKTMKLAYKHAISSDYRFYSYGDASLLFRHGYCLEKPKTHE